MSKIKKGDYIEGYEEIGSNEFKHVHKMRIIVDSVHNYNGETIYHGQADDAYGGARGGSISESLGEVRVITNEKPFENNWWEKDKPNTDAKLLHIQNRAVLMTEDKKCILRGTSGTLYELCLRTEKSKRNIKEFRGLKSALEFTKYSRIKMSDEVVKHYNLSRSIYKPEDATMPRLIAVKVKKILTE